MKPSRHRLAVLLVLARLALVWEQMWPRLWPAAAIAATFLGIAWLDVLPRLPAWLHAAVLVATAISLAAVILSAIRRYRPVAPASARRRIEADSALADRPLAAIEDQLAAGRADPLAEALWQRHRAQMLDRLGNIRIGWPRPDMARVEPFGLRAAALLVLAVGLAAARHEPAERLARALDPGLGFAAAPDPVTEVWISPPPYTRVAPAFLRSGTEAGKVSGGTVTVPVGSDLRVRVTGVRNAPVLRMGEDDVALAPLAAANAPTVGSFVGEGEVRRGERLAILAGRRTLAEWPMRLIPDQPPEVALTEPPMEEGNGLFRLLTAASDDYGIKEMFAIIRRADDGAAAAETPGPAGEIRLDLPVNGANARQIRGESRHDLSSHRWAGSSVVITVIAVDEPGHVASSAPATFILPERRFTHPVARAIVAARKQLDHDEPVMRRLVASQLQTIAAQPADYDDDVVVQLALVVAKARLAFDRSPQAIDSVRDLLWSAALRLEEGDVPAAERLVAEVQQRLREALARDAPIEEIERLMNELQAALDRYLEALAQQLARRDGALPDFSPNLLTQSATDLQEILETARQMARAGARESAERMLAELQQLLEQLRAGELMTGSSEAVAEARAMLEALGELKQRQERLLEDTFEQLRTMREGLEGSPRRGAPNSGKAAGGAQAQQRLQQELAELIARAEAMVPRVPGELGEADQAMRGAIRALEQSRLGEGANRQGQAVDALSRAMPSLARALAQSLGGGSALVLGRGALPGSADGDAFGRRAAGGRRGAATDALPIPDASSLRRAQEILNELRRRAGQPERPVLERDYIERMLRPY